MIFLMQGCFFLLRAAEIPKQPEKNRAISISAEKHSNMQTQIPTQTQTVIPFFSGKILSVQVSEMIPEIQEQNVKDPVPEQVAFVEIQAMLDAGRGSSRFDYVLKIRNRSYPCIAVALADDPYSMNPVFWHITGEKEKRRIRFLFPVDKEILNRKEEIRASLVFVLRENLKKDLLLPLMFLPDGQAFSPISQVPESGICGLDFEQWQKMAAAPEKTPL